MEKFCIGDKVIHSPEGVCVVEDICELEIEEKKRTYYMLRSLSDEHRVMYIPINCNANRMRHLMSREAAKQILDQEPLEQILKLNIQKRTMIQNQAIREDDSALLIGLIKVYIKKRMTEKISVGDYVWLKIAEKYLLTELAEVMNYDYSFLLHDIQVQMTARQ